jgi:hypothetical protein
MNGNQVIRPEIKPIVNGGHPGLAKIRRKFGFTFVLSNPFRVPVTQSAARLDASKDKAGGKMKRNPLKVKTARSGPSVNPTMRNGAPT